MKILLGNSILNYSGPEPAPPNWYSYVHKKWAEYYVVHPLFYAHTLIWHVYFELWNYNSIEYRSRSFTGTYVCNVLVLADGWLASYPATNTIPAW